MGHGWGPDLAKARASIVARMRGEVISGDGEDAKSKGGGKGKGKNKK